MKSRLGSRNRVEFGNRAAEDSFVREVIMLLGFAVYVGAAVGFYLGMVRMAQPEPEELALADGNWADRVNGEVESLEKVA